VAVISSGDAGIYGMAGLVYEVLNERSIVNMPVEVIPGVTAICAAAALVGAPLMTDFAIISLSDQLIPRDSILKRVELAIQGDFVIGFYNPKGQQRRETFDRACEILVRYRAANTPVGIVRAATREGQQVTITTLGALSKADVDMLTVIIVGNSKTSILDGRMVTSRGYDRKYQLADTADRKH
jgi:precorrin-3B C17-methyltransferase